MHQNLERRFINLETARSSHLMALMAFSTRFHVLFAELAKDLGILPEELGERLGWKPVPAGGNKIMRGEAEPSKEDCYRLLMVYLEIGMNNPVNHLDVVDVPRCGICDWPLRDRIEDGCTVGNCSMRGR